jgi:hypothetical protein
MDKLSRISITMDAGFCLEAIDEALARRQGQVGHIDL